MSNSEQVALLRSGRNAWNAWRQNHPDLDPDLSGAQLSNQDFSGFDFHDVDFRGSDLRRTNISHANLAGALLREAQLDGMRIHSTNFSGTDLRETNLRSAEGVGRGNFEGANLSDLMLDGCDLGGTNLAWAILRGASLNSANLTRANLRNASLKDSQLRHAQLGFADLGYADLRSARLEGADVQGASMIHGNLNDARLIEANLRDADCTKASLVSASLMRANLTNACLKGAHLIETDLRGALVRYTDMQGAVLSGANLATAMLIGTRLDEATIKDSSIFGVAVWGVTTEQTKQSNILITPPDEPLITVDNIELGQFIYMLLGNAKARDFINTVTTKVVLILGRFDKERKPTLDAMRLRLRELNYSPIVFDFQVPATRDFTETVQTLALLSRFIIADVTDPRSIPQEVQAIVPHVSVPMQPVLHEGGETWDMLKDFEKYPWFLPIYRYQNTADLLASLQQYVIEPAETKARALHPSSATHESSLGDSVGIIGGSETTERSL